MRLQDQGKDSTKIPTSAQRSCRESSERTFTILSLIFVFLFVCLNGKKIKATFRTQIHRRKKFNGLDVVTMGKSELSRTCQVRKIYFHPIPPLHSPPPAGPHPLPLQGIRTLSMEIKLVQPKVPMKGVELAEGAWKYVCLVN